MIPERSDGSDAAIPGSEGASAAATVTMPAEVSRALGGPRAALEPAEPPTQPTAGTRLTERALRLGTVAAVAAAVALATGHAWVLAMDAAPIVLIALAAPGSTRPTRAAARVTVTPQRCFEGEPITARIDLAFDGVVGWIDPGVFAGPGVELT